MFARRSCRLGAVACAGLLGTTATAWPAPPADERDDLDALRDTISELRREVAQSNERTAALQAQVDQLRNAAGEQWLTEQRADQVRALVADVLADADLRTSLLDDGILAGWDNGFFLGSPDGAFLLKLAGQLQVRYIANSREDDGGAVDDWENGFQLRRVKLNFSGHIGSPRLEYVVQLAANRNSTTVELEDAIIAHRIDERWRIWGGRFQDVFSREQMMSSRRQQTVDRSAVANIFAANDGYVEGVGVEWLANPECLRLAATINDGLNSGTTGGAGTGFQNTGNDFQNDSTDFALSARAEWKVTGAWQEAADVTSWQRDRGLHAFLGAGLHYEVGETGDGQASATTMQTGPYDSFLQWTVDGLLKNEGLGMLAAFHGWHFDADGAVGDTDHYAATVQLGYMIVPDEFEPFIRYEWIDIDDALDTNDLELLTAGFNWYLQGHAAKLTADIVWAMDNINATTTLGAGLNGIGLLPDAAGEDDQLAGRLQFQLLF